MYMCVHVPTTESMLLEMASSGNCACYMTLKFSYKLKFDFSCVRDRRVQTRLVVTADTSGTGSVEANILYT